MSNSIDQKPDELTPTEQALLIAWRKMAGADQQSLLRFIDALVKTNNRSDADPGEARE